MKLLNDNIEPVPNHQHPAQLHSFLSGCSTLFA